MLQPFDQNEFRVAAALPQLDERGVFRVGVPRARLCHAWKFDRDHYVGQRRGAFKFFHGRTADQITPAVLRDKSRGFRRILAYPSVIPHLNRSNGIPFHYVSRFEFD